MGNTTDTPVMTETGTPTPTATATASPTQAPTSTATPIPTAVPSKSTGGQSAAAAVTPTTTQPAPPQTYSGVIIPITGDNAGTMLLFLVMTVLSLSLSYTLYRFSKAK